MLEASYAHADSSFGLNAPDQKSRCSSIAAAAKSEPSLKQAELHLRIFA